MEKQPELHRTCLHLNKKNQNKSKTKSSRIQIDQAFYCTI